MDGAVDVDVQAVGQQGRRRQQQIEACAAPDRPYPGQMQAIRDPRDRIRCGTRRNAWGQPELVLQNQMRAGVVLTHGEMPPQEARGRHHQKGDLAQHLSLNPPQDAGPRACPREDRVDVEAFVDDRALAPRQSPGHEREQDHVEVAGDQQIGIAEQAARTPQPGQTAQDAPCPADQTLFGDGAEVEVGPVGASDPHACPLRHGDRRYRVAGLLQAADAADLGDLGHVAREEEEACHGPARRVRSGAAGA